MMIGKVDSTVAVAERNSSQIPEYQHEAPFLVVHVPGVHDHFLCFAARVGVEEVG